MKTAAFYSYKGGVGRSLFVANLALFLAYFAGKKVLVLDMDLEAPGMPYKFKAAGVNTPLPPAAGIVDTVHHYLYEDERPETLPIVPLQHFDTGGSVHLYAAGAAPTPQYWTKLSEIDFHWLARGEENAGGALFLELYERIQTEFAPDIVLIDARTGFSDIAGAAAQVLAQQAYCLMLDEDEHYEGIRSVMRGIAKHQRVDGQGLIQVIPVLSRVHSFDPTIEKELRKKVRARLTEPASLPDDTLIIPSDNDVVLLHNDDNVYRSGRVLLEDLIRGGNEHPSRLVRDYYTVGLGHGFFDSADRLTIMERVFPLQSIKTH